MESTEKHGKFRILILDLDETNDTQQHGEVVAGKSQYRPLQLGFCDTLHDVHHRVRDAVERGCVKEPQFVFVIPVSLLAT
jgi:hypothetical protein